LEGEGEKGPDQRGIKREKDFLPSSHTEGKGWWGKSFNGEKREKGGKPTRK